MTWWDRKSARQQAATREGGAGGVPSTCGAHHISDAAAPPARQRNVAHLPVHFPATCMRQQEPSGCCPAPPEVLSPPMRQACGCGHMFQPSTLRSAPVART